MARKDHIKDLNKVGRVDIKRTVQEHQGFYAISEHLMKLLGANYSDIARHHYDYIRTLPEDNGDLLRYVIALRREMNARDGWRKAQRGMPYYVRIAECEAYAENRRRRIAKQRKHRKSNSLVSPSNVRHGSNQHDISDKRGR